MGDLKEKPEEFYRGQKIVPRDLNELNDSVIRTITGNGNVNVRKIGDRLTISGKSPPGIPRWAFIQQFVVLQELEDYLVCTLYHHLPIIDSGGVISNTFPIYNSSFGLWGGEQPPNIIYVAKPFILQQTAWNQVLTGTNPTSVNLNGTNVIYNFLGIGQRKAINFDNTSITEYEVIVPAYFPGDIIQALQVPTGLSDPMQNPIQWMDLNTAARAWASSSSRGEYLPVDVPCAAVLLPSLLFGDMPNCCGGSSVSSVSSSSSNSSSGSSGGSVITGGSTCENAPEIWDNITYSTDIDNSNPYGYRFYWIAPSTGTYHLNLTTNSGGNWYGDASLYVGSCSSASIVFTTNQDGCTEFSATEGDFYMLYLVGTQESGISNVSFSIDTGSC